jgi:hypothetical protein
MRPNGAHNAPEHGHLYYFISLSPSFVLSDSFFSTQKSARVINLHDVETDPLFVHNDCETSACSIFDT